jgi:hypothetical protein
MANWRVVPVFEYLTQIAHVEPSLAAGTVHKVIGFTLRDIIGITSAFGTNRTRQRRERMSDHWGESDVARARWGRVGGREVVLSDVPIFCIR